jgi:hypothetical protein
VEIDWDQAEAECGYYLSESGMRPEGALVFVFAFALALAMVRASNDLWFGRERRLKV